MLTGCTLRRGAWRFLRVSALIPGNWFKGPLIYLRRTDGKGRVQLLGSQLSVDPHWVSRLVRCEVYLHRSQIKCFALRRRAPSD